MSINPRLADRRVEVAEDRAKRNVWRLLRFFLVVAILGGLTWFALSPWMSVVRVRTAGVQMSDTASILESHRFAPGTPMVLLRTGPLLDDLRADPWVRDVEVSLSWPSDVVVRVEERVPRAWVETSGGWVRRSEDGFPLPSVLNPDASLGRVVLPHVLDGEAVNSELVLGSIEFLASLPDQTAREVIVRFEEAELWALVDGFEVRLGRAVDMREKALSLLALLERGLEPETVIILIAPTHPSVIPPALDTGEPDEEPGDDAGGD